MLYRSRPAGPQLKSEAELQKMRTAGRLAAECLQWVCEHVVPGISTQELDDLTVDFAKRHGATSATLGYKGYPKSLCTSINEVICHGIPSTREILKEGDIVGIDVTLIVDGFYGDTASTVPVGQVTPEVDAFLHATLESLRAAIEVTRPGAQMGDIGHAIQKTVEPLGYSVVRDFVGHGIGRNFHEPPQVMHYGKPGRGLRLRAGMTFTIEPMINMGHWGCRVLDDGWTAVTNDGKLSAQYEHTLAVTPEGVEILTVQNGDGSWEPPGRAFGFSS